jgi:hypothetical protein
MTAFTSWIGADQRGAASLYIATDSRISWEIGKNWDFGRKVFASKTGAHIFGYVGDVLFPSLILGQIVDVIDAGLFFENSDSAEDRFEKIKLLITKTFQMLPHRDKLQFKIAYGTREGIERKSSFHVFEVSRKASGSWESRVHDIPNKSDTVVIWGSATRSIEKWKDRWDQSSQKSTSRAVFSAHCDAVESGEDSRCGGSPQLVGLYRIGGGRVFGVVSNKLGSICGLPVLSSGDDQIKWYNRYFERCGKNGVLLPEAKHHHVPMGLGGKVSRK